jgi:hypothetical protein
MFRIFNVLKKNIKRLMGGDKLRTIDVMIHDGMAKMSLTLKRGSAGDLYVVLANLSSENKQYSLFEPEEFDQFVAAAVDIRAELAKQEAPKMS